MTGRLVDMAFTLGGKQRVTLEINGDFREIWDKLHQEQVLDVEIKKHREKRSLSANAYFHVLCNKISAETGESEDAVKRRLVWSACPRQGRQACWPETPADRRSQRLLPLCPAL